MRKPDNELRLGEEAIGGLAAGVLGTVIGFPLDLVKTRMQVGSVPADAGILQVATHIVRTEGILALYKGLFPPLVSLSILNTVGFSSYSFFRGIYGGQNRWDFRNALAGASGCALLSTVSTVENVLKTQMQLDNVTRRRFQSSWQCAKNLVQSHGPLVLYTGHGVNTAREAAFMASYFFTYEGLREFLLQSAGFHPQIAIPISGGTAGALAWFFSFPLDCIRAGVQGRNFDDPIKKGPWQILTELVEEKGIRGLYSGVAPSIARAFLVSGSRFSAYETALWLLRGGRDNYN